VAGIKELDFISNLKTSPQQAAEYQVEKIFFLDVNIWELDPKQTK